MNSLLSNWESVDEATKNAMNSAGSANRENEKFMNSVQAHINEFKSAFSEFSASTLDSDVLKFIIDIGTAFINITKTVGAFNVVGAISLTVFQLWATKNEKAIPIISKMATKFQALGTSLGFSAKMAKAFSVAMSTLVPILVINAIILLINSLNNLQKTTADYQEDIDSTSSKISELSNKIEELNKKTNKTDFDRERISVLEKQVALEQKKLEIQKEEQFENKYDGDASWWEKLINGAGQYLSVLKDVVTLNGDAILDNEIGYADAVEDSTMAIEKRIEKMEVLEEDQRRYTSAMEDANPEAEKYAETISNLADGYNDNAEAMIKLVSELTEYKDELLEANEAGYGNTAQNNELIESIDNQISKIQDLTYANGEAVVSTNNLADSQADLENIMSNLENDTELLTKAWEEQSEYGKLSLDTVLDMIIAGGDYLSLLHEENGVYTLNGNLANALFESKKAMALQEINIKREQIKAEITAIKAQNVAVANTGEVMKKSANIGSRAINMMLVGAQSVIESLGGVSKGVIGKLNKMAKVTKDTIKSTDSGMTEKETKQLAELEKQLKQLDAMYNVINNTSMEEFANKTDKGTKAVSAQEQAVKGLEDELDSLNQTLDDAKKQQEQLEDDLKDTEEAYKAIQEAIVNQIEKEIELQEVKKESINLQKEIYEAMQDVAQEQLQKEIDAIQDQIDALDEKKKEEDDILKLQEAQADVAQKQKDLMDAKSNKDTRVYTNEEGWHWEANPDKVDSAESALADAMKNLIALQKEFELARKKADLQGQIDELEKLKEAWGKNMSDIENDVMGHKQVIDFMNKFESASYSERQRMLLDFTGLYKNNVIDQNRATEEQIKKLQSLKDNFSNAMNVQTDISKYTGAVDFLKRFENASYSERLGMLNNFTNSWRNYNSNQTNSINGVKNTVYNLENAIYDLQTRLNYAKKNVNDAIDNNYRLADSNYAVSSSIQDTTQSMADQSSAQTALSDRKEFTYTPRKPPLKGNSSQGSKAAGQLASGLGGLAGVLGYANGGVTQYGADGIIDQTGDMMMPSGDVATFHGGTQPEVILNNHQASRILYELARKPSTGSVNNDNSSNSSNIIIQNLNVQANNSSTLDKILREAKQQINVGR